MVMWLTCICEVPGSRLHHSTGNPRIFINFTQSLQVNAMAMTTSSLFPIHCTESPTHLIGC